MIRIVWRISPCWLAFAMVVVGVGMASPVRAQTAAQGRRQYMAADFERSTVTFERVLALADLTPEAALEAHRYLAALHFMLQDEAQAAIHAAAAVALDPGVSAPEGAPPEVDGLFGAARERGAGRPAAVVIEREPPASDSVVHVVARLEPAPEGLAAEVELRCEAEAAQAEQRGPVPSVRVDLTPPEGATWVDCRASAITAGGATILDARRRLGIEPAPVSILAPEEPDESSELPWPWIAVGAGAAAIVATVVIVAVLAGGDDQAQFAPVTVEGW